jgi:hypothetical protein
LEDNLRENEIIHRPGYTPANGKGEFKDRQLDMAVDYLRGQIRTAAKAIPSAKKSGGGSED